MALISDPEQAKRLARHIASDLALYNEKKVVEGIEKDIFFDIMKKEIDEGREHYKSRVTPDVYKSTNFYDRAIVDIILSRKKHIKSKIW
jgi:hypothetical protein